MRLASKATEWQNNAGTLAAVFATLALLFTITTYVDRWSDAHHREVALEHKQKGDRFVQSGQIDSAIEQLHAAVMMDRARPDYVQALARALYRKGSLRESQSYIRPLLDRDPIDGETNLLMARVMAEQRKLPVQRGYSPPTVEEVEAFYRRAVYGRWASNASERHMSARFELIKLLEDSGRRNQTVAELAAFAEERPNDPAVQKKIAGLLMEAESPGQAGDIYRRLIDREPRNGELHAALARAEFEQEHYPEAQRAYRNAVRWSSESAGYRRRLAIVNDIRALDPTDRRLNRRELFERSERLLRRAVAVATGCTEAKPQQAASLKPFMDQAAEYLKAKKRSSDVEPAAGLKLAEDLWSAAGAVCDSPEKRDEVLSRVLARLEK